MPPLAAASVEVVAGDEVEEVGDNEEEDDMVDDHRGVQTAGDGDPPCHAAIKGN